jgi:hemerythrin-like metal-binding protein
VSVGIADIDAQHQHFIALVNELNKSILWRMPLPVIRTAMLAIYNDAKHHFNSEELLFKEWNYPETHIHAQILQVLREICNRFRFNDTSEYELIDAGLKIKHTLVEHLLTEDMKYRDFFYAQTNPAK